MATTTLTVTFPPPPSLLVTAAQSLRLTRLPARSPAGSLGLGLGPYDANVAGGALLGAGMALAGACPGTVLAQVGTGVPSGRHALAGGVLAGVVWSWVVQRRRERQRERQREQEQRQQERRSRNDTVYEALGISRAAAVAGFEVFCVAAIAAAVRYAPPPTASRRAHPVLGGLFIAAAQLASLVLRGALLGMSSAFEDLGRLFWGLALRRGQGRGEDDDDGGSCAAARGETNSDKPPKQQQYGNILVSAGAVAGAWLLSSAVPSLNPPAAAAAAVVSPPPPPPVLAGLGGFLMVLGARIAGGCTSGHGISGLSLLSTASFLTVAATFAAGGLTKLLIG